MSSRANRRQWTTEQKVAVVRRHLVDKVPASQLCEEMKLQPSVFYQWLKQAFDNMSAAFVTPGPIAPSRREKDLAAKNAELAARLAKKDAVIAEISEEYVKLKKEIGEL
jgi:transposase